MDIKLFKKVYKSYIYEFLNESAIDNWIHGNLILSSCNTGISKALKEITAVR